MELQITADQQKIIDLIKTWEPKNVKTALILDTSQCLGVEELYASFLDCFGFTDSYYSNSVSDAELTFPIQALLYKQPLNLLKIPRCCTNSINLRSFINAYLKLIYTRNNGLIIDLENLWDLKRHTAIETEDEIMTIFDSHGFRLTREQNNEDPNTIFVQFYWFPF
ncbi:hypothetical protein AB832_07835 [Flavobacteriaceae bacterium (ex Bugula neritina AB1)]|nr:hypothetical protein AB832_07835 [Flavobacteriaceae bacterium (ex Bugula neritina AB1)]